MANRLTKDTKPPKIRKDKINMGRIHSTEEEFLKDTAVKEFTKALRKFSEGISFSDLIIHHEIETTKCEMRGSDGNIWYTNEVISNDYFEADIFQRIGKAALPLRVTLLEASELPPIYLSQCEYDMLATNDQKEGKTFGNFKTYLNMQAAGWFKDVPHDMLIDDIIVECKIK